MASGPETHELVDRSAECWRKVKSETGFDTYKEYLSNTEHYKLKDYLEKYINVNSWRTYCSVFDLSETGSLSSSFDETRLCQRRNDLEKLSTELLTVLRKPPSQASFRVLLLEASRSFGDVDPMLVSAVGLGLRIPPEFFEAYLARNQYQSEFSQKVSLKAKYGTIGKLVFMVARDYLPGRSSCPPVLLIMGSSLEGAYDLSSMQVKTAWPKSFKLLLSDYTKRYQSASLNLSMVLVHALLPLLEICLENLKESHDKAHADYLELLPNRNDNDGEATMGETRFRLRRQLRHYEKCMSDFMRYLRTQDITGLEKYEALLKINEEAKACLDDARGLESEIRDWLQLQVGDLALQESKKSIQLSNLQMEESKRVKIVTILAFVYVPLNLATSIFGMNIQQLNQNGQHIWVFIITAAIALFLTFFVWFCIVHCSKCVQWREQMSAGAKYDTPWLERGKNYNFVTRVAILTMLLWKGYGRWVWITGAWIRILTNERAGARHRSGAEDGLDNTDERPRSESSELGNENIAEFHNSTACDYVCKYIGYGTAWFYFDTERFRRDPRYN